MERVSYLMYVQECVDVYGQSWIKQKGKACPPALIFSTWIWKFMTRRLYGGARCGTKAASARGAGVMFDLKNTSK